MADGRAAVSAGSGDKQGCDSGNLETGKVSTSLRTRFPCGCWGALVVDATPDGRSAVSGGSERELRGWLGRLRHPFEPGIATLRVWDLNTGECLRTLTSNRGGIDCLSVTPDCRRAVTISRYRSRQAHRQEDCGSRGVRIFETGASQRVLEKYDPPFTRSSRFEDVCVTADGRRFALGNEDQTVQIYDLETAANLPIKPQDQSVKDVKLTRNGRIALSAAGATVRVWELDTGSCLRVLRGHKRTVWAICVLPDDQHVVTVSDDQTMRVWEIKSGICLRILKDRTFNLEYLIEPCGRSVTVLPDGDRVVSAVGKKLRVRHLKTGSCIQTLKGHSGDIQSLAVTPDGQHVLSTSAEVTDTVTGQFGSGT